ncbi:MAG: hypothetical protein KH135_03130, partial [Firmicutes bacterium]|nr:hypothetical protein [Bacillota bacterium]
MISSLQLVELQNSDNPTYQDIATDILLNNQYKGSLEIANKIYHCLVEVDKEEKETKLTRLSQLKNYRNRLNSIPISEEMIEQKNKLEERILKNGELLNKINCLEKVIRNGLSTLVFAKPEVIQDFIQFANNNKLKHYINIDIDMVEYYKEHPSIFTKTTPCEFFNMVLYANNSLLPELQILGYCNHMNILEFMNEYSYLFMERVERVSDMMEFVKEKKLTHLFETSLRILCGSKNKIEKKLIESKQIDQEKQKHTESLLKSNTSTLMNGNIQKMEWNPYLLKQLNLSNKRIPKSLLTLNSLKLFQKIVLLQETPYVEMKGKLNPATFVFEKRLSKFHMGYDTMAARILYLKSNHKQLSQDELTCTNYKWDRKYVMD